MAPTPPRVFGIPALDAPVVAVLRRGSSDWHHVGRWDHGAGVYEPGAWIRANLYPQRADLSPDGRWLAYLAATGRGEWAAGSTYLAVARLPWVFALAAWDTGGTRSRGVHFVGVAAHGLAPPDAGAFDPRVAGFGLAGNPVRAFAVEHRRGWAPSAECPGDDAEADPWDERRADRLVMEKRSPTDPSVVLRVGGAYAAFRSGPPGECAYALGDAPLTDVQWADWASDGRLLVATTGGVLQVRTPAATVAWEHDLARLRPDPRPAPGVARTWR